MVKKVESKPCSSKMGQEFCCCNVASIVNVDERGQMVLPKEIREKANIKPGDKLAVISLEKSGFCCITLIKTDNFAEMVKNMLGPMMKEIITG